MDDIATATLAVEHYVLALNDLLAHYESEGLRFAVLSDPAIKGLYTQDPVARVELPK
jgi:hypothetical protein